MTRSCGSCASRAVAERSDLTDGTWRVISRDEVKRRFREGKADVLLCTDAAAEGLNFQFCGALINYDMPWNPMRVEQRIGRIDRLGQRYPKHPDRQSALCGYCRDGRISCAAGTNRAVRERRRAAATNLGAACQR